MEGVQSLMAAIGGVMPPPIWCLAAFLICLAVDFSIHLWFYFLGQRGDLARVLRDMPPQLMAGIGMAMHAARWGYALSLLCLVLSTFLMSAR